MWRALPTPAAWAWCSGVALRPTTAIASARCCRRRCVHGGSGVAAPAKRGGQTGASTAASSSRPQHQARSRRGKRVRRQQQRRLAPQPASQLQKPEALAALLGDLEAWALTAPAGCTVTSGKVARALSSVRAGERTAYLQRAAELGHANAGVALEFLRLVFTDPEREWQRGAAMEWSRAAVDVLAAAELEMRVQPLLWVLTHCAKAGADAGRACVILSIAQAGGVAADVHLYSALVNVAAKQQHGANFALALRLVETMRAEGVAPNEVTHNSLIDALGRQRTPSTRRYPGWVSGRQRGPSPLPGDAMLQTCNALLRTMVELDGRQPDCSLRINWPSWCPLWQRPSCTHSQRWTDLIHSSAAMHGRR